MFRCWWHNQEWHWVYVTLCIKAFPHYNWKLKPMHIWCLFSWIRCSNGPGLISGMPGTRLQHGSTTCAVYIREDWEASTWLGSHSSVVKALAAQAGNLGLFPSDSLPFFLLYIQPGLLQHLIYQLARQGTIFMCIQLFSLFISNVHSHDPHQVNLIPEVDQNQIISLIPVELGSYIVWVWINTTILNPMWIQCSYYLSLMFTVSYKISL